MTGERALDGRIAEAERAVEIRRERVVRHWDETLEGFRKSTSWWPAAAIATVVVVGIVIGRSPASSDGVVTSRASAGQVKGGALAMAVAVFGAASRILLSPQAHALWRGWRERRRAMDS